MRRAAAANEWPDFCLASAANAPLADRANAGDISLASAKGIVHVSDQPTPA